MLLQDCLLLNSGAGADRTLHCNSVPFRFLLAAVAATSTSVVFQSKSEDGRPF